MIEKDDVIPDPMSDIFTASLWSDPKNEHLLRSFINGVRLNSGLSSIVQATVLNPFNIREFNVSKRIVLDVRVKDEREHLYDVEVQNTMHTAFPNRVLDYCADMFSSQLKKGMDYSELRPVISIILTAFPIFPQLKEIHTIFLLTAQEDPRVVLTKDFQIHILRLFEVMRGRVEKLSNMNIELCNWLHFFSFGSTSTEAEMSQLTNNSPIILEAYDEMHRFFSDPATREKAIERRRFLSDYQLGMNASKAEGKADSIVIILADRFGVVSFSLEEKLRSLVDVGQLDRLTKFALRCNSLEEFENGLV